ncbi:MAG: M15 family metallopeptidase [Candidatus Zambryskibacteria bacterium]|nr:M15 family metallopeptidase [Candidatus Zambryskibacteria bacterium]
MKDLTHFKLGGYKLDIQLIILIFSIAALVLAGYVAYQYRLLGNELKMVENNNSTLQIQLEKVEKDKLNLSELSAYQQSIIDSFQGQISNIGQTVGTLEKLAQTDKELLKKYSKVYFLNENYVPAKLTQIDEAYIFAQNGGNLLIHNDVWSFLKRLLENAHADNIDLLVVSAFRSFDTQAALKSEYKVIYGAGTANQFSADQGYSEHQLGTSADFTTSNAGATFSKFQTDPAYQWLKDNAYKYGFALSYPENNSYYKFEPWHWRFVGVELAKMLHRENKYFYDLDQRDIDPYLIKLFD